VLRGNHEEERIQTTLGDLVAALSDAALECCDDQKEAYILASLALHEILMRAPVRNPESVDLSGQPAPDRGSLN
jgi:hypothetical protein